MSSSDLSHAPGPAVGSLANVLEDEKILRERIRDKGHVTRWPSAITVGIPSVKAMGLNARLLNCGNLVVPVLRGAYFDPNPSVSQRSFVSELFESGVCM